MNSSKGKSFFQKQRKASYRLPKLYRFMLLILIALFVICSVVFAQAQTMSRSEIPSEKVQVNEGQILPPSSEEGIVMPEGGEDTGSQIQSSVRCSQVDIPFNSIRQPAIWLNEGQVEVASKGIVGKKRVCIDAHGKTSEIVTSKPFDEVLNVGTKVETAPPTAPQYTFEQALAFARQTCSSRGLIPDSTDMSDCKTAEMHKYGY